MAKESVKGCITNSLYLAENVIDLLLNVNNTGSVSSKFVSSYPGNTVARFSFVLGCG